MTFTADQIIEARLFTHDGESPMGYYSKVMSAMAVRQPELISLIGEFGPICR
jgi:hypothetical protein